MKLEVLVISKEIIKPSSPTPHSLRKHRLSYLDQLAPPLFMPFVYFYPRADGNNNFISNSERLSLLKISLSDALTRFYPLAGKVVESLYVDCNDAGVGFVEAQVNVGLPEILLNPNPAEFNKFYPYDLDEFRDFCIAVKVSFFTCGGMAIGIMFSHKIGDATSLAAFADSWAAIARGDTDIMPYRRYPKFEGSTIFPPKDRLCLGQEFKPVTQDVVTKIFAFPASKIDALKSRYVDKKLQRSRPPTRVEALSTFIWSRFMACTDQANYADPADKIYAAIDTTTNLRPSFYPPLSRDHFGNYFRPATAILSVLDKDYNDKEHHLLVIDKIRESKSNVMNGDYLDKLQNGYSTDQLMDIKDEQIRVRFIFTSLCRFPLYGVDFGWGRPIRVSSAKFGIKNVVTFFDAPSGNGIEAWINLEKNDMAKFEADMELRAYLSQSNM